MIGDKLFILLSVISVGCAAKLPNNWMKCPRQSNSDCLKKAVEFAVKDLKNGNKALGIVPVDPLHIERATMSQGGSGNLKLNLTFFDADFFGLSKLKVNNAKADWDNYEIEVDYTVDGLAGVVGGYSIDGKVLVLPISGKGHANISLDNYSAKIKLRGKEMIKKNKKYFDVTDAEMDMNMDGKLSYYELTNLFNGNKELGDNMNVFLNENSAEIFKELKKPVTSFLSQLLKQAAKTAFDKVPIENLVQD